MLSRGGAHNIVADNSREAIAVKFYHRLSRRLIDGAKEFRVRFQRSNEDGERDPFRRFGQSIEHLRFPRGTLVVGGASLSVRLAVGNHKILTDRSISSEIPNAPDPARFSADHTKRLTVSRLLYADRDAPRPGPLSLRRAGAAGVRA